MYIKSIEVNWRNLIVRVSGDYSPKQAADMCNPSYNSSFDLEYFGIVEHDELSFIEAVNIVHENSADLEIRVCEYIDELIAEGSL